MGAFTCTERRSTAIYGGRNSPDPARNGEFGAEIPKPACRAPAGPGQARARHAPPAAPGLVLHCAAPGKAGAAYERAAIVDTAAPDRGKSLGKTGGGPRQDEIAPVAALEARLIRPYAVVRAVSASSMAAPSPSCRRSPARRRRPCTERNGNSPDCAPGPAREAPIWSRAGVIPPVADGAEAFSRASGARIPKGDSRNQRGAIQSQSPASGPHPIGSCQRIFLALAWGRGFHGRS